MNFFLQIIFICCFNIFICHADNKYLNNFCILFGGVSLFLSPEIIGKKLGFDKEIIYKTLKNKYSWSILSVYIILIILLKYLMPKNANISKKIEVELNDCKIEIELEDYSLKDLSEDIKNELKKVILPTYDTSKVFENPEDLDSFFEVLPHSDISVGEYHYLKEIYQASLAIGGEKNLYLLIIDFFVSNEEEKQTSLKSELKEYVKKQLKDLTFSNNLIIAKNKENREIAAFIEYKEEDNFISIDKVATKKSFRGNGVMTKIFDTIKSKKKTAYLLSSPKVCQMSGSKFYFKQGFFSYPYDLAGGKLIVNKEDKNIGAINKLKESTGIDKLYRDVMKKYDLYVWFSGEEENFFIIIYTALIIIDYYSSFKNFSVMHEDSDNKEFLFFLRYLYDF
jgi:hypothetical protein